MAPDGPKKLLIIILSWQEIQVFFSFTKPPANPNSINNSVFYYSSHNSHNKGNDVKMLVNHAGQKKC